MTSNVRDDAMDAAAQVSTRPGAAASSTPSLDWAALAGAASDALLRSTNDKGGSGAEFLLWLVRHPVVAPRTPPSTVQGVTGTGTVAVVAPHTPLIEALRTLVQVGCLALPVVDATSGACIGSIDYFALAHFIMEITQEMVILQQQTGYPAEVMEEHVRAVFLRAAVTDVLTRSPIYASVSTKGMDGKGIVLVLPKTLTLFSIFDILLKTAARRVVLVNSTDGAVDNIITESMLVSLLTREVHRLSSSLLNTSLEQLGRAGQLQGIGGVVNPVQKGTQHSVLVVSDGAITLEVLALCIEHDVAAIPMVDSEGMVTSVFSVRDLRAIGMNAEYLTTLCQPVSEFKKLCRRAFASQTPARVVTITPESTLRDVLLSVHGGNLGIVVVVEDKLSPRPLCVLSLKDILRLCLLM